MDDRPFRITVAVLVMLMGIVFLTDLLTQAGFAHGMLYVPLVLIAVLTGSRALLVSLTLASCVLILVGLLLSPPSSEIFPWSHIVANRAVSALVLITSCILAVGLLNHLAQRRQAERELAEAGRMLQMASEVADIGGWTCRADEQRIRWSSHVHRIHGSQPGTEFSVSESIDFFVPEHQERARKTLQACIEHGKPFDEDFLITTTDGNRLWTRVVGRPWHESDEIVGAHGAVMDIDQTKRSAQRLTSTLESITDAFFLLDTQWRFAFINRRAELLLESKREDLLGQDLWQAFPEALGTQFETQYRHAMSTDEPVSFEAHFEPLQRTFEVRAFPSDEGLAVYFHDITERLNMEEKLRQSQRLESIGQLTGGIAHDFNNLLTILLGNAELMREMLADDPKLSEISGMMVTAAQRGAELTQRLLAFARRQALEPKAVNINRLIARLDGLLRRSLGDDVEIELTLGGGLWTAMVDEGQLENAVLNLCLNARDAMSGGGRLTIETANMRLDQDYADQHDEVKPGQYVMIAISDTGRGIDAQHIDKVFEPFFTTKAKGKGTGLGLSMTYGFVKQSDGHIKVYSELDEGTTIRMYLPRALENGNADSPATSRTHAPSGSETILVVEDDELVRRFARDQLTALGYRVVEFESGPQAVEFLRSDQPVDLLFTDVVMPGGMSGKELADQAWELRPGLRVLFTSGYTENAIVHHGRLDRGVQLLSKPYRRAELARRVRDVLSQPIDASPGQQDHDQ
jgi:PAS domain S-box-containing protein